MPSQTVWIGIIKLPIAIAFNILFEGYVLSLLWGWFVVPAFGVPTLSLVPAIGISLAFGLLRGQAYIPARVEVAKDTTPEERDAAFTKWVTLVTQPPLERSCTFLALGWIMRLFM